MMDYQLNLGFYSLRDTTRTREQYMEYCNRLAGFLEHQYQDGEVLWKLPISEMSQTEDPYGNAHIAGLRF